MKIGILTLFYNNINYGGCLQAYALTKVLNKMGYDAEQISFEMTSLKNFYSDYTTLEKIKVMGIKGVKVLIDRLTKKKTKECKIQGVALEEKKEYFTDFIKNIKNSNTVYSHNTLTTCLDNYDAFIVGSDQVWNFRFFSPHHFLEFVPMGCKKKIAYSASTGGDNKFDFKQKEYLKKSLKTFDAISVREASVVKSIRKITKQKCINTLDPTLLLNKEDYDQICAERIEKEKYLFCYFLNPDEKTRLLASKFAKQKDLKIVIMPMIQQDVNFGDRQINKGPAEFLSLIKYAEYVFTDSFHAVVFSRIYQKDFYSFGREGKASYLNLRLKDLLSMFDNSHRFFKSSISFNKLLKSKPINYDKSTEGFYKLKEKSLNFLIENLKEDNKKKLPIDNCTACRTCESICPKNCISIKADKQGRYFPKTDEKLCVSCDLCKNTCPVINRVKSEVTNPLCYAVKTNDTEQRLNSSSGGIFYEIAKNVLQQGGAVFGAAFNTQFKVEHICIDRLEDLHLLQGSKYVQSDIGDSYKRAEEILKTGRKVLFSGTSCQIFGLKNFLKSEYKNLLTIDLICHGTPLDWVWEAYLNHLKKRFNSVIKNISFRDKSQGWRNYCFKVEFVNGEIFIEENSKNTYMLAFLKNYLLKQSCYNCYFKGFNRVSDFTLGDAWGIERFCTELDDNLGVSVIYVNSQKAKILFEELENVQKKEVDKIEAIKSNPMMISSVTEPKNREKLLKKINEDNFEIVVKKYLKKSLPDRIIDKLKRFVK